MAKWRVYAIATASKVLDVIEAETEEEAIAEAERTTAHPPTHWMPLPTPPTTSAERSGMADTVEPLMTGEVIQIPVSREHAEKMLLVAEAYLRDNS